MRHPSFSTTQAAPSCEQVPHSEAVLRGMLAASPDCVKVLSADGYLEFMNDRGVELNQLDAVTDVLGLEFASMWPAQEQNKIRMAIRKAAGGELARAEGFCPTAKGEPRWWEASFAPFQSAGSGSLKLVGISRDITERVQAEQALRLLNEQLEEQVAVRTQERDRLWQVSRDMLIVSDLSGVWLSVNPAFTRVLGWHEQELVGRTSEWLRHPDDQALTQAQLAQLVAGEAVAFENRFRTRSGDYRRMSWTAVPFEGRIYGVVRDVTNEHAQSVALIERTDALRLHRDIVQSDEAPIVAFDHAYRVIAFNRAHRDEFWRVMGREQEIGDVLPDLFPVEQAATLRSLMDRALTGERFVIVQQFGDPGHEVPSWEITYTPLRDADARVIGAFHHARNISEKVRAEASLLVAEEALRQSQKMEAVGQLTGGVAHDFNNLLTIIRSSVDFLRRPDLREERRRRYLDAVSETVDRAAKLTGQLLAFARRQALKPEVFDVGHKLRGVADMLDSVTGSRVRVAVDMPDTPCHVRADVSQFETSLVNMAVNARDAMNGEGTLTLGLGCGMLLPGIRGHAPSPGPFVAISVSDTGGGISPGELPRIFEPFFTTKEVGKGTGLGLSQVFGFAKQSGGDIDVTSEVGRGTTFTLYLPEVRAVSIETAGDKSDVLAAPLGKGLPVLIVEDNIGVGQFCTQILDDLGYAPTWAVNAEDALVKLGTDGAGFTVVFSDVVMPGMGGVALAEVLRERIPDLPVVLTSGYSHVLARENDHGFELLHKPYSADQLARILQRVTARVPVMRDPAD